MQAAERQGPGWGAEQAGSGQATPAGRRALRDPVNHRRRRQLTVPLPRAGPWPRPCRAPLIPAAETLARSPGGSAGTGPTMAGIAAKLAKDREAAEGLGSHERAVKYLNQDYAALRDECLEAGALFQDPSFPALPSSLGFKELGPYSSKTRGIEWKRPTVGSAPGAGCGARRRCGPASELARTRPRARGAAGARGAEPRGPEPDPGRRWRGVARVPSATHGALRTRRGAYCPHMALAGPPAKTLKNAGDIRGPEGNFLDSAGRAREKRGHGWGWAGDRGVGVTEFRGEVGL